MRKISLWSSVLITLTCFVIPTYAYELLSSRIEVSPGIVDYSFKRGSIIVLDPKNVKNLEASAKADNAFGQPKENIKLSGSHGWEIINNSSLPQVFILTFTLTAHDGQHFLAEDVIRVMPREAISGSAFSGLVKNYPDAGIFALLANTAIVGTDDSDAASSAAIVTVK